MDRGVVDDMEGEVGGYGGGSGGCMKGDKWNG